MSKVATVDWEFHRNEWESDEQWQTKLEFLRAHQDNIDHDRLLCLAQTYSNIEFLGCRYPKEVSQEVIALSSGLPKKHLQERKRREESRLVEAKEKAKSKQSTGTKRPLLASYNEPGKFCRQEFTNPSRGFSHHRQQQQQQHRTSAATYFDQTTASSSSSYHAYSQQNSYQTQNYYTSGYQQQQNRHSTGTTKNHRGGGGRGNYEGGWRQRHSDPGNRRWMDDALSVDWTEDTPDVSFTRFSSVGPKSSLPQVASREGGDTKLSRACEGFVLVERTYHEQLLNPVALLQHSAAYSRKTLAFNVVGNRCSVCLGEVVVAEAEGSIQKKAKLAAAELALNRLRTMVYTLQVKCEAVHGDSVSREQLDTTTTHQTNDRIADDNIGSQMLKKMGWTGGGLGKFHSGRLEPPEAERVVSRAGLGCFGGDSKDFRGKVEALIRDYMATASSDDDLVFDPVFSSEERRQIHHIASCKFRLKSYSRGKGSDRYLIVTRKLGVEQLVQSLQKQGGSNAKYSLVAPK